MNIKKEHLLFLFQAAIAIVVFISISNVVKTFFLRNPKAQSYLSFDKGVKEMASSSTALVDSLIAHNDLTFDPTSGKLLDKVLNNLKFTNDDKMLIIGSSQMRAVQGMGIEGYNETISRKLNLRLKSKYQLYNLSLGGMTTLEKLIMAKKSMEILNPQRMLISVTPWDCISDKVRPEVKAIEDKTFIIKPRDTHKEENYSKTESDEPFPLNMNSKVGTIADQFVENIEVYSKRAAIKKWLNDETIGVLVEAKGAVETKQDLFKSNIPEYWRTIGQDLDNITGWDKETAQNGVKSIKIINGKSQNAKWLGDDIILENPTRKFEFEGWSKADKVSPETKLYCLDFQVIFEDGTSQWYFKGLKFRKGTHDWERVSTKVIFEKKVNAIRPHMLFYGGTGTVWFDNIKARPIFNEVAADNILPNPSFEVELKERQNVSYSYTDAEWERIKHNMFSIIEFLSGSKNNDQNVLLMTPFWHTNNRSAYPQKKQYNSLVNDVEKYCKEKDVAFVNASFILSENNFGVYTKGSVRDKIDVLHFNA